MLRIQLEPPHPVEKCSCCGAAITRLTRFVYKDNNAYSIYYALFTEGHADRVVTATISLGDWDEAASPAARRAFALTIRADEHNFKTTLIDAEFSPWKHVEYIGSTLNRSEALAHPWLSEVFAITDAICEQDIPIKNYLENVQ